MLADDMVGFSDSETGFPVLDTTVCSNNVVSLRKISKDSLNVEKELGHPPPLTSLLAYPTTIMTK